MPKIPNERDLIRRFESLITQYGELRSKRMPRFLQGFRKARMAWAAGQKQTADDFNLFEVIKVDRDEVRHSKVLAWLLDHRIEYGTHAQGNLGFRLLLEELRITRKMAEVDFRRLIAHAEERDYWVIVEVKGANSRVDIEIASRKFLIHIENKIHSGEGDDQTNREYTDMQARGEQLGVPVEARHGIFLTLSGARPPKNPNFCHITWDCIATFLNKSAEAAGPGDVKLFARHYSKAIQKLSNLNPDGMEVDVAELQRP